MAGDPVDILTGRLTEEVVDWSSGGSYPLVLKRQYTSTALTLDASPYSSLGRGWRTNFDARVRMNAASALQADWAYFILPDTMEYNFNKQNGVWKFMATEWSGTYGSNAHFQSALRNDMDVSLTVEGQQFVLRTSDGTRYVFDTASHGSDPQWFPDGYRTQVLSEIRYPGGYAQKIIYTGDYPSWVSDNLGRWINMQFAAVSPRSTLLSQVQTSDGSVIKFTYQNRLPGLNAQVDFMALSTVIYPDLTPATDTDNPKISYQYKDENRTPGLLLIGMTDERGVLYSTWTYDAKGRVLSSEHAGGQDRTQFAYDDTNKVVTVTNSLGRATKYSYRQNFGYVRQLLAIDGIATPGCAASNTRYEYDANGFRSRATDAEGRVTQWTRDSRGLPLSEKQAVGTPAERTSTMTWDATRPLLISKAEPGLTSSYTYDAQGRVTSAKQIDTSVIAGRVRVASFGYSLLAVPPDPGPVGQRLPDVVLPIVNPSASQGVTGWTSDVATLTVRTDSPCSNTNPCFFGGVSAFMIAHQDIAIPSQNLAEVNMGLRAARISWLQNAWTSTNDAGTVDLVFLDGAGQTLGSALSPLRIISTWTTRSRTMPVPPGTRTIRILLLSERREGRNNDGYVDDLQLTLVPDGGAAADPYLAVANPSGLQGAATGWTPGTVDAVSSVQQLDVETLPPCSFCTVFRNRPQPTSGVASAFQVIAIPADRTAEIDSARRSLEVTWLDRTVGSSGEVSVNATYLDASRKVIGRLTSPPSPVISDFAVQSFNGGVIPPRTRFIALGFQIRFPLSAPASSVAYWTNVSARLVARPRPSEPISLLTSEDGPLPEASDTVRYGYDSSGRLVSVSDELGRTTRITAYDGADRPLSIAGPNGEVTNMAYDARGRLTSVVVRLGALQARTTVTYDAAGQVTRLTAPDGSYLAYTWSDARRLTAVVNNAGERIDYGYNANGDVTSRTVKSASGAITRQQSALFDELGRLLREIGAAGQETRFAYDRTDNLTQVNDPRGGVFAYAYDGLQALASLTDQAGNRTRLTRDGQGEVTGYTDPRGLTTRYVRNGFGEVIQESGPDVGTTGIIRDERGLPTRIMDPRGVITNLTYDAAGRLVKQAYPADPKQDVTYVYDDTTNGNKGIGRLTGVIDASGAMSRYYDALGRVIAETRMIGGKTYSTAYAYNAAGRLTAITYPSGRVVSYTRNGLGRVTAVATRPAAAEAAVTVASGIAWSPMSSRLVSLTHGNGLAATRAYDGDGRLTARRLANGSTRLMDLTYAYADGMNLTAVNDNLNPAQSVSLGYDAAQHLATARGPWGQLAYAYTPNGDRAQEVLTPPGGGTALTTKLSYPATSNRLSSTTVGSLTTRSFTYDAAGNLASQVMGPLRLGFAYDLRNRPVTVTRTGDGTQVSRYAYNALEQMVSRSTNAPGGPAGTVHYIYGLDGSLLAEADAATGATLRDYIWLPQGDASPAADNDNEEGAAPPPLPLALVTGVATPAPSLLMVHPDHLGRPLRLTDATRATVWQASYDPFGQPVSVTGTVEQNLRFPGQYFLIETGLSYNWHRFYDPATGRYTQPDPLRFVDGPSVYAYAGQSPMMRVDPEGEQIRIPFPGAPPIGTGPYPGNKPGPDWRPGLKPRWPVRPPGLIDYIWNGCEWIVYQMSGKEKDVPYLGPPGGWVDGKRRSRQYGPDGRPVLDIDKPHQGAPYPHVHEWPDGVREEPGRPVSPLPRPGQRPPEESQ